MKISYSHDFNKKKVSSQVVGKFKERVKLFEVNKFEPILNNHKLHGEYEGSRSRSINITGNFRAVFEYVTEDQVVFYDIGTHPELYE